MKIKTTQNKTIFNKKIKSFTTEIERTGWKAEGKTKEQSIQNLEDKLANQQKWLSICRAIRAKNATFVLYYADGWQYSIFHDESCNKPSITLLSSLSYSCALESMAKHVEQFSECN